MDAMTRSFSPGRRHGALDRGLGVAVGLGLVLMSGCVTTPVVCTGAAGRSPDNCLGFRFGSPPTVDGVIAGDEAWVRGFQYVLGDGNGSTVPHAIVQGMRGTDALFLSFEVNNDPTFDLDDAIVLAFDPTGDAANHRRIHIYPVFPAGASPTGTPQAVDYWKGSVPDWTDPSVAPIDPTPSWLLDNIRVSSDNSGTSKHWRVEIRIPVVADEAGPGINLPADNDFGFYFSVLMAETDGGVTNIVEESWPVGTIVGPFIESTPPASAWGNGIFGHVANGVTISSSDITTDQSPAHHIDLDNPNTFYANVHNNMADAAGTPVVANNVRASFHLRNFGIPGAGTWDLIPTGSNPTPLANVPAAGAFQFQTAPWTVPSALRPHYQANPFQCLRVELTTTGPGTLLVNRRAMRNMKFVETSSPFRESAVVGTEGYRIPPGERDLEILLREFRYNTRAPGQWHTDLRGAERVADGLYRLRTRPGPDVRLDKVITPPTLPIPMDRLRVPPGRPGQARRIPVQPGNLITVVAAGSITRGEVRLGPNGADLGTRGGQAGPQGGGNPGSGSAAGQQRFMLPDRYAPERRVGALIGVFDGAADDAFVIGAGATIRVPEGARTLSLAINDTEEGWQQQRGDGFGVEVIQTPLNREFAFTTALLPQRAPRLHQPLPLGQNLPTWILCGHVRTGETVTIRGRTYQRFQRAGCYGYMVKRIAGAGPGDEE